MASQTITTYLRALGRKTEYAELLARANQLTQLKQKMTASAIIPAHLIKHCELGPLSHGKLTLFAHNASVATKLKHISPSLLLKLQKLEWNVTAIKILVQKPDCTLNTLENQEKPSLSNKPKLSQAGIDNLNKLVRTLPDSELKQSIQSILLKNDKT